jgi:hypothetical protein
MSESSPGRRQRGLFFDKPEANGATHTLVQQGVIERPSPAPGLHVRGWRRTAGRGALNTTEPSPTGGVGSFSARPPKIRTDAVTISASPTRNYMQTSGGASGCFLTSSAMCTPDGARSELEANLFYARRRRRIVRLGPRSHYVCYRECL